MRQLGARSFDIDINTGAASLLPPPGEPVHPEQFEKTVKEAGFELLGLELEVRGRLGHVAGPGGGDVPAVEVESTGQSFVLLGGDSDRERDAWARLSPDLENSDSSVSVRGRVQRQAGGGTGLVVVRFQMLDD